MDPRPGRIAVSATVETSCRWVTAPLVFGAASDRFSMQFVAPPLQDVPTGPYADALLAPDRLLSA